MEMQDARFVHIFFGWWGCSLARRGATRAASTRRTRGPHRQQQENQCDATSTEHVVAGKIGMHSTSTEKRRALNTANTERGYADGWADA